MNENLKAAFITGATISTAIFLSVMLEQSSLQELLLALVFSILTCFVLTIVMFIGLVLEPTLNQIHQTLTQHKR